MTASTSSSRWPLVLYLLWALLAVRVVIALVRHESLRDDTLSLPLIAFFVTSAIAGGRLWTAYTQRASS